MFWEERETATFSARRFQGNFKARLCQQAIAVGLLYSATWNEAVNLGSEWGREWSSLIYKTVYNIQHLELLTKKRRQHCRVRFLPPVLYTQTGKYCFLSLLLISVFQSILRVNSNQHFSVVLSVARVSKPLLSPFLNILNLTQMSF